MSIPRVAIVGRPNAGKSSIMNMIAGAKVSIVDPTPGVTRDRVAAIVELEAPFRDGRPNKLVEFMDTGGFGVYVTEGGRYDEVGNDLARLTQSIEFQIEKAVQGADLILFCVDAQAGVTPHDKQIAQMLRQGGMRGQKREQGRGTPPIRVVATKVDGPKWEAHAMELAELGFGEPLMVSAKINYMRRDFLDQVYEVVPQAGERDAETARADLMLAIIGKRNAGKSTLVNTLAGEERVIASEIPGTTRDAIDVRFEMDGKSILAIDTAGLRKKKSFQNMIEQFAFDRVQRSVDRADVIALLLDATERISQVDEQLAMLAQKSYKPCIIIVNKWDLAEGQRTPKGQVVTPKMFETYIRDQLRGLWYAPISFISGSSGAGVRATMRLAFELKDQAAQRVTTGKLNRMVRDIIATRGPSDDHGRFAKVFFVAQTGTEPPTITMVVNHPEMFTPNYLRFLSNRFREELPFSEVPMRIVVRERRQIEDDLVEASEGGEGATIRVSKGRKGVSQRVGGKRIEALREDDDAWLSDEHSAPVRETHGGEVSDEEFVPEAHNKGHIGGTLFAEDGWGDDAATDADSASDQPEVHVGSDDAANEPGNAQDRASLAEPSASKQPRARGRAAKRAKAPATEKVATSPPSKSSPKPKAKPRGGGSRAKRATRASARQAKPTSRGKSAATKSSAATSGGAKKRQATSASRPTTDARRQATSKTASRAKATGARAKKSPSKKRVR